MRLTDQNNAIVKLDPSYTQTKDRTTITGEERLALAVITQALEDWTGNRRSVDAADAQSARDFLFARSGSAFHARMFWLARLAPSPTRYDEWLQQSLRRLDQLAY